MSRGNTTPILDVPITFIPGFLSPEIADTTLAALLAELPWERRIGRLYGKDVPVPRMEVWVADHAYTYSHRTYQPLSWTPLAWVGIAGLGSSRADHSFSAVPMARVRL
jgi:alkylated DNA repair dioxygenase AlkB